LGNDTLTLTLGLANNNSLSGLTIKNVESISYVGLNNTGSGAAAIAAATTAAATAAADLAAVVAGKAAATANKVKTAAALVTATTADTAADAIVTSLTTAGTGLAALLTAAADMTAVATVVNTAVTAKQLSAVEAVAVKAAATPAAAATLVTGYSTAATGSAVIAAAATQLALDAATLADTTAGAAVTAYADPATTAITYKAYLADANAKAALEGAKATQGTVTLAANADATSITIDGTATTVSGLKDAQTITMSGTVANTVSTAAGATTANVKMSSGAGTVTIVGDTTTTTSATVSGSLKLGTAETNTGAAPGTLTLVDQVAGTTTGDSIKTLNLGLTSNSNLTITDMTAVTTIDGSASTGGLGLSPLATTLNVTTGAGADTVTFIAATDVTNAKKLTSSLSTGAGNDKITVTVTGTGTSSVNAGAGDDSITLTSGLGTAVVDGGEGKDTVVLTNTSFGPGTYNNLKLNVLNTEVLSLSGAVTALKGTKAAQITEFTLTGGGTITNVADTQSVNITASASASADGYIPKGGLDANDEAVSKTVYAGTLTATAKGTSTLTAGAQALNLAVSNVSTTTNGVAEVSAASVVTLTGDVKTATITVGSSVNNSKLPTSEFFSSVIIAPTDAGAGAPFTALGNLTSVTLSGTGSATVTGSATSKLATIDASGLAGKVTIVGSTLGAATAGLTWTAGTVAETVKLGSALDKLTIATATASNYSKMDSITGFTLVGDATGVLTATTAAKSDDITVGGLTNFAKAATGYSTTSLDAALNTLANRASAESVVFQTGGNTYIFIDATHTATGGFDDTLDTVVELVGLIDLDNLVLALNGLN
jgi:hypothetical protein